MTEKSEQSNLHLKLLQVRKSVTYLQKGEKGTQYNYVSSSQVLSAVREKLDELGILLKPEITGHNVREKEEQKKDGKATITYFTEIDMRMTWINADDSKDTLECSWYAQGVDIAGEKGVGKALTYGEKYFMLKFFNIATDKDDPDAFQQKHSDEPATKKPSKPKGNLEEANEKIVPCKNVEEMAEIRKWLGTFSWTEKEVVTIQEQIAEKMQYFELESARDL